MQPIGLYIYTKVVKDIASWHCRGGTFFELNIERNGIVTVCGTITASFRARPRRKYC